MKKRVKNEILFEDGKQNPKSLMFELAWLQKSADLLNQLFNRSGLY